MESTRGSTWGISRYAGRTRVSRGSHEGRGDDTSEAVRRPREGYSGFLVACITGKRQGKGTRVAAGLPEGDTRVTPGSARVAPEHISRVTPGLNPGVYRGYAQTVGGFHTEVTPGKHEVQARVTTEVRPSPGGNQSSPRVVPGRGACRAEPRQNHSIIRA